MGTEHGDQPQQGPCGQCGKPAIGGVNGTLLCVDCYYKLEVGKALSLRGHAMFLNYAAREMEIASGVRGLTTRMQVPDLPTPPPVFNNIRIDRSTVGAINTGTIHTIDVAITTMEHSGNTQVSHALTQFTQAVADDNSLSEIDKKELLEQVAYLSEQAAAGARDRRPGMIKAVFEGITKMAAATPVLITAWSALKPFLLAHFGIIIP